MNLSWSTALFPALASNMPMPGAYLSLKPAPLPEAGLAWPAAPSGENDRAAEPMATVLRKSLLVEPDLRNPMISLLARISGRQKQTSSGGSDQPEGGDPGPKERGASECAFRAHDLGFY